MYWDALTAAGVFAAVLLSITLIYLSQLARQ